MGQCCRNRNPGELAAFLVDDMEYFAHGTTDGERLRPTGESFSTGVKKCHPRGSIGSEHSIANRVEGHSKIFFADLHHAVGMLEFLVQGFLELQQMFGFLMYPIFMLLLLLFVEEIDKGECCQQNQQADGNQQPKQTAHI